MTFTVLRFLWRRHRLTLLLATLIPVLIGLVDGAIYQDVRPQAKALESIPFVRHFLQSDFVTPFSPESVMAMPFQHPLCLLLFALFPAIPAIGTIAAERGRGGLDLLLASPLERRTIVHATALFNVLTTPMVVLSAFVGTVLGGLVSEELAGLDLTRFLLAGTVTAGLVTFWSGVALTIAAVARDRTSGGIAVAVVIVVAFALDSAARLTPRASWFGRISPYGYYRPADIVGGAPDWGWNAAALGAVGLLLAVVAAEILHRRSRA